MKTAINLKSSNNSFNNEGAKSLSFKNGIKMILKN
jgi:hypothetical protein